MPWRKYTPKEGKYGPNYEVAKGIKVRKDARGKWTLFIDRKIDAKTKPLMKGAKGLLRP